MNKINYNFQRSSFSSIWFWDCETPRFQGGPEIGQYYINK